MVKRFLNICWLTVWLIFTTAVVQAQESARDLRAGPPWAADAYTPPQPREPLMMVPGTDSTDGPGGWATLAFMVDASGRAFDIRPVAAASAAALAPARQLVRDAVFEPARIGVRAVPGAQQHTVWLEDPAAELAPASRAFADALSDAEAGLLPDLAANAYEETLVALAQYNQAAVQAPLSARFDLLHALAEDPARLRGLPPADVETVLLAHYALALRTGYPGAAYEAGERLLARALDNPVRDIVISTQAVLARLRDAPEAEVVGRVRIGDTGHAAHALLRPRLRLAGLTGELTGARLHCEGGFLELEPVTGLVSVQPAATGRCRLVVSGAPGTSLDVVQF